jgi:hypothetical protein
MLLYSLLLIQTETEARVAKEKLNQWEKLVSITCILIALFIMPTEGYLLEILVATLVFGTLISDKAIFM